MPLTNEQAFAAWAPDESPWSVWTKPVLFAHLDVDGTKLCDPAWREGEEQALPPYSADVALVVDLPGGESARTGLELARRGWRPVPLFNATNGPKPIIDVTACAALLRAGAEILGGISQRSDAPPAFLIDSGRTLGGASPGDYDNRSVVLPQDFPSGTFLKSKGIRDVIVVRQHASPVGADLEHVLLRWKQAGLMLCRVSREIPQKTELEVKPPSRFRKVWYRVIALMGLRRANVGGFGGVVPEQTSGGGYG